MLRATRCRWMPCLRLLILSRWCRAQISASSRTLQAENDSDTKEQSDVTEAHIVLAHHPDLMGRRKAGAEESAAVAVEASARAARACFDALAAALLQEPLLQNSGGVGDIKDTDVAVLCDLADLLVGWAHEEHQLGRTFWRPLMRLLMRPRS